MKDNYFYIPGDLDDNPKSETESAKNRRATTERTLEDGYDPDELLEIIYDKNGIYNNRERDLKSIQEFIEAKKDNQYIHFMHLQSLGEKNNVKPYLVQYSVDPTRSSDAFMISETGSKPENDYSVKYRITIRNSDRLRNEDVLAFIQAFQKEAKNRGTYIRCKVLFNDSDGIIFYTDIDNLSKTIKILEDLKDESKYGSKVTNAIKNFGGPQPFSATLSNDSYYSIAMHGAEPKSTKIKTSLGGGLFRTYNEYIDDILDEAYNHLYTKYNGDKNRITPEELYNEMIAFHTSRMGTEEAIPLWMNNRIYEDLKSKRYTM